MDVADFLQEPSSWLPPGRTAPQLTGTKGAKGCQWVPALSHQGLRTCSTHV